LKKSTTSLEKSSQKESALRHILVTLFDYQQVFFYWTSRQKESVLCEGKQMRLASDFIPQHFAPKTTRQ
jgi:hypothetical protein